MDSGSTCADAPPVISLDDDHRLIFKRVDPGTRDEEPQPMGRLETQVLVQIMVIESGDGRLEDVARGL